MRILCCGDRDWTDKEKIRSIFRCFPEGTVIIHGACRGADRLCGEVAKEFGFWVDAYPADWKNNGKIAGPVRNRKMLREGKPDMYLAFHENIAYSKGTWHMIQTCENAKVPGVLIT